MGTMQGRLPHERLTHDDIEALRRIREAFDQEDRQVEKMETDLGKVTARRADIGERAAASPMQDPMFAVESMLQGMVPIGQMVVYRARTRGYRAPAIVTANVETLDRRGVVRGDVPDITGELHVHLNVQTCGLVEHYQEHDVPFSREPEPGTWGWQ